MSDFSILHSVVAQADAMGVDASALEVQSIWDFVIKGGPMMIPIGLCSLFALAVIAERLVQMRRSRVIPSGFQTGLQAALKDGSNGREAAIKYCRANPSPVANVFGTGLRRLGMPLEILERHISEAGEREVLKLRKHLRSLSVIAAVTPLLGLLGTIFGMISAFQTVATSGEALGKAELLAGGIYEAMITTAAGLIVAIPVLIMHHVLTGRIERLVMEIDQMSVEFVEEHALPGALESNGASLVAPEREGPAAANQNGAPVRNTVPEPALQEASDG